MAMGTRRQREKQEDLWIAHAELASAPGHPFYQRLNEVSDSFARDGASRRPVTVSRIADLLSCSSIRPSETTTRFTTDGTTARTWAVVAVAHFRAKSAALWISSETEFGSHNKSCIRCGD